MVPLLVTTLMMLQGPLALQASTVPQPPAASHARPETPWPPAGAFRPGGDVTAPKLIRDVKPKYTAKAMDAKIQGSVLLEAVVEEDGTVGEVRVTRSLDREFGLDDEAVDALKKWEFDAGTKDGVPVPVVVEIEMTFTLKN